MQICSLRYAISRSARIKTRNHIEFEAQTEYNQNPNNCRAKSYYVIKINKIWVDHIQKVWASDPSKWAADCNKGNIFIHFAWIFVLMRLSCACRPVAIPLETVRCTDWIKEMWFRHVFCCCVLFLCRQRSKENINLLQFHLIM